MEGLRPQGQPLIEKALERIRGFSLPRKLPIKWLAAAIVLGAPLPCGCKQSSTHKFKFFPPEARYGTTSSRQRIAYGKEQQRVWDVFGRALRAEPRDNLTIRGSSGLDHVVEAIFVDDKSKRVIIVSAEPNPRIAALMRVDVQATFADTRVLVARPISFDISAFARRMAQEFGLVNLPIGVLLANIKGIQAHKDHPDTVKYLKSLFSSLGFTLNITLPVVNQILAAIQELALLDWQAIRESFGQDPPSPIIPLTNLLTRDSMAIDRQNGICPLPLYEFTENDWELFLSGRKIDDVEERLKALGIFQYFFPPPDQIALGFADRNSAPLATIASAIELAPAMGHPLASPELVNGPVDPVSIVEQLIDQRLLVEGEIGFEVTKDGNTQRATVRFRPREGLISKLLQRFNVKIDVTVNPKDWFRPL